MKYYAITMPRGHVGHDQYAPITFNISAENLLEAVEIAKKMPGVKHSRMPLQTRVISQSEYEANRSKSAYSKAMVK